MWEGCEHAAGPQRVLTISPHSELGVLSHTEIPLPELPGNMKELSGRGLRKMWEVLSSINAVKAKEHALIHQDAAVVRVILCPPSTPHPCSIVKYFILRCYLCLDGTFCFLIFIITLCVM